MSLHVVHVSQPTTAGVPRCVINLVRQQAASGFEVTVVSPDEGWLAAEAVASGAVHVAWAAGRSPGPATLYETETLRNILHRLTPHLVHLHSAKAGLAGRLALQGKLPTVFQPHAWSFQAASGPLGMASLAWERWAVRWTHRIVCVSEAERAHAVEQGVRLEDRARVVPNAVDTARYSPRDRSEARRRLRLPEGPLAVCVGRVCEQKGQDVLLQAWAGVQARIPGARLAIVGDGPWLGRLKAEYGDIAVFVGNSRDPRDWYAAADVVVVPSRWEGMAFVPLEAGASCRSVVITDIGGAREALPSTTRAIVPIEDVGALARAVAVRLQDRWRADREGAENREHVSHHLELATTAANMQKVYAEVLPLATGR